MAVMAVISPVPVVQVDRVERWITALESGRYRQIRNYLHDGSDGYCATGVGLEVFRQETGFGEWDSETVIWGEDILRRFLVREGEWTLHYFNNPPIEMFAWYGVLSSELPISPIFDMNDAGEPFSDIARYLKESYL
jgi:hypothetical protein